MKSAGRRRHRHQPRDVDARQPPTLHRGLALRHRVVEVHPARGGDPARGLRQRRVLLHEIEDRLQPFTFPGLVSISMTSTRDKGLTAVTMPIFAPQSNCHHALICSGSRLPTVPALGSSPCQDPRGNSGGRSARDGVLGCVLGYPGGNGHVAGIWPARLAGKNDAGSPRKSPERKKESQHDEGMIMSHVEDPTGSVPAGGAGNQSIA
jgi:hypothetical protein